MDGEGATYSGVCRGGCEDGLRRPQGQPEESPWESLTSLQAHAQTSSPPWEGHNRKERRPSQNVHANKYYVTYYPALTTTVSISHHAPSNPLCFDYHISPSACLSLDFLLSLLASLTIGDISVDSGIRTRQPTLHFLRRSSHICSPRMAFLGQGGTFIYNLSTF